MPEFMKDLFKDDGDKKRKPKGGFSLGCPFCNGTGIDPSSEKAACPVCKGKSTLKLPGSRLDYIACRWCQGTGSEPRAKKPVPCRACHGRGIL